MSNLKSPTLKTFNRDERPPFFCPKCKREIDVPIIWGCGWDRDSFGAHPCPNCGYDGYLETMTGEDEDGTVWQFDYSEPEPEE